jgi:hypothetical protein
MNSEDDLIKKLMVSKAIMDKHNKMPRSGDATSIINTPTVESFEAPSARYNLPNDVMVENKTNVTHVSQPIAKDRILSSKLPDEIKRLMIEHPIVQSNPMVGTTLSNDLIDKASRLMNVDASGKQINEQSKRRPQGQNVSENVLDNSELKDMVKVALREILSENGLITESTQKSNDIFSFRVGKHIFEGKVTKIKKVQ